MCLHILQRVDNLLLGLLCLTFVVIAVGSCLEFAWTCPAIGVLDEHRGCHHGDIVDATHVEARLLPWCPSEETVTEGMGMHRHPHTIVATFTYAMESHNDTPIDISCCHIGGWQVEVLAYDGIEGGIGFLVGEIGTAIGKGSELLLADVVTQQRRVMTLHEQLIVVALDSELCLHTVSAQEILEIVGKLTSVGHCF